MFLESMITEQLSQNLVDVIVIVISQINLMLSLINDMFDLQSMARNRFVAKNKIFNPLVTFKFITDMFTP